MLLRSLIVFYLVTSSLSMAGGDCEKSLEPWLTKQSEISLQKFMANISPEGTLPGTVVASPSKSNPNYFYHWIRDAGLVMNRLTDLYLASKNSKDKSRYLAELKNFARVTRIHQQHELLGEVKFYPNGLAFTGPWGRPQNDGPAIRAIALIRLASILLSKGQTDWVREHLYGGEFPATSVIKKDLEYISHHWQGTDFDLWEEVRGAHFFTRMAQRKALLLGSKLARKLADPFAADWYYQQGLNVEQSLDDFYYGEKKYVLSTIDRDGGIDYKSGLDSSVILAALYFGDVSSSWKIDSPAILKTIVALEHIFTHAYTINEDPLTELAPGIGRYKEDQYDGLQTGSIGNPWFLLTAGFAQFHFKLGGLYKQMGSFQVSDKNKIFFDSLFGVSVKPGFYDGNTFFFKEVLNRLIQRGEQYLKRVRLHTAHDGSMSEQFNRHNGYMQGARDLTWSHSSFLGAYQEFKKIIKDK